MDASWNATDTGAILTDGGDLLGWLRITEWYGAVDAAPTQAWVADYIAHAPDPQMLTVLVEEDGTPASSTERREALVAAADSAIAAGPAALPPLALASAAQGADEIDLLVDAWSFAQDRVFQAAARTDEHASHAVYIALTELLNWTYTLDSVLDVLWRKRLDASVKEDASKRVDVEIAAVIQENKQRSAAHNETWIEPTDGIFAAYRERQATGHPYPHWAHLLGIKRKNLDPRFFSGLKWVRGQLAHRGVILAVDLHQWKPGAKPSWLWRKSTEIEYQSKEFSAMSDYDAVFGGKPVVGMLNVITELSEVSWIFAELLEQQAKFVAATP